MKTSISFKLVFLLVLIVSNVKYINAQTVSSDQWAATDGLGRELRNDSETGTVKNDKFI